MFHWICPECGREIPPAVKECPACDPQAAIATPPELPPVTPFLPELPNPSFPHLLNALEGTPPELPAFAVQGAPAATALLEPPVEIPGPEWAGPDFTKRTQQLLPAAARSPLLLGPASGTLAFAQVLLPPIVPNGLVLAADRLETLVALADAVEPPEPAAEDPEAVTLPAAAPVALPRPKSARDQARALGATVPIAAGVLDLFAPKLDMPAAAGLEPRPAVNLFRVRTPRTMETPASKFGTRSEAAQALPMQAGGPIRPKLQPVAAPAAAGMVEYSAAVLRAMRPSPPPKVRFVPPAEPRITLPGPALPRELKSLAEAGLRTVLDAPRGARRRSGAGMIWMALTVVVLLAASALYIVPPMLLNGKTTPVQAEAPPAPVAPAAGAYPLSKTIEVTGFRFVVDLHGKSEIHYLVVNHSAAQFGAVTVYVTLRDAEAKAGQAPVARFSFRAPDMGPYTSREMTSPIEKISRPVALPDWQALHADVEIAE